MRAATELCFAMLLMMMAYGAKKGKKDNKMSPHWKPSSMPDIEKRSEFVYEGRDTHLNCRAQAHPKPNIKWLKDGNEVKNNENIEIKKMELILMSVSPSMSGNYTCVVSNKHGQIEWTFNVIVQVKIWPLVVDGPSNITGTVGSSVTFGCQVLNDPHATIRWQRMLDNQNVDEHSPNAEFMPDSDEPRFLTLDNIKKEDEREYRCMAGNIWGLKYLSAWLKVIEPAIAQEIPRSSEMDSSNEINNSNNNKNKMIESEPPRGFYDNDPMRETENTTPYDWGNNSEDTDSFAPDLDKETSENTPGRDLSEDDSYFAPTKQQQNRNKSNKNGLRKDRKNKNKNRVDEVVVTSTTAVTTMKTLSVTTTADIYKTTSVEIWKFATDKENVEFSDSRNTAVKKAEITETDNADGAEPAEDERFKGSISTWTIYTIVGAVGGVVLLIGLLAITLTLCCKRDENSAYKSTSV